MNPRDFVNASGKIVQTAKRNAAFAPAPLPPRLTFENDVVALLSRADTALAELSATGRHLPYPHLLIAPYIRREAVLSSRIEGTHTNLPDFLLGEIEDGKNEQDNDTTEVGNYVKALEHGIARLPTLPLSLRLVRELHELLMQGVRGANKTPGEFRTGQNFVGSRGQDEATAPYVPPPVAEMHEALNAWEAYVNQPDGYPTLIQCALQHVQFESIHPFGDGNGRVGRLLISLFLIERGRLSQPLLYLSGFIDEHRQDYYNLLQRVRTHSAWDDWIRYFLTGVIETASQAAAQATELLQIREEFRKSMHAKPKALALIDHLLTNPYVTVGRATRLLQVSQPTARSAVMTLQAAGILIERTGRAWGRVYVAPRILDAIDVKPARSTPPISTPL